MGILAGLKGEHCHSLSSSTIRARILARASSGQAKWNDTIPFVHSPFHRSHLFKSIDPDIAWNDYVRHDSVGTYKPWGPNESVVE